MARHIDADEALRMMRNSKQDCPVVDDKRAVWDVAHDCAISCVEATPTADVVPRAEVDKLEYTLIGVMHSVDKWLDGEELNQDEVNRAATMREKTLRLVEGLQAEVERLEGELIVERTRRKNAVNAYHSAKQEVARVIFEDLESICLTHVCRYNRYLIYSEDFAALKKKYMEGGAKNEES